MNRHTTNVAPRRQASIGCDRHALACAARVLRDAEVRQNLPRAADIRKHFALWPHQVEHNSKSDVGHRFNSRQRSNWVASGAKLRGLRSGLYEYTPCQAVEQSRCVLPERVADLEVAGNRLLMLPKSVAADLVVRTRDSRTPNFPVFFVFPGPGTSPRTGMTAERFSAACWELHECLVASRFHLGAKRSMRWSSPACRVPEPAIVL